MKKLSLKIAALVVALSPITAMAMPMVVEDTCLNNANACTVGIDGLDIMGMTFNVDFVQGSYDSIFAVNDPFFLGDQSGAIIALTEIIAVLNATTNAGTVGTPDFSDSSLLLLPYEVTALDFTALKAGGNPQSYSIAGLQNSQPKDNDYSGENPRFYDVIATFDKVGNVPEPGTLSLLAIGLAGLGISRRQAKSQRRA